MGVKTVLEAARLIDGTGRVLADHPTITIEGNQITAVNPSGGAAPPSIEPDCQRLAFPDCTILPGLIDMHAHLTGSGGDDAMGDAIADSDEIRLLRAAKNAETAFRTGVTTIRDCGSPNSVIFVLKDAIRKGIVVGPRLVVSGAVITVRGGHCHFWGREANGTEETRRAVREQIDRGADFVKIMATGGLMTRTGHTSMQYSLAELDGAVAEAHRAGRRVAMHCLTKEGVETAAAVGADTIEHAYFFQGAGVSYDPKVVEQLARRGIPVTAGNAFGYRALVPGTQSVHPEIVAYLRATREGIIASYREMWRFGIPLLPGPDAGWWHVGFDDYVWNLRLMAGEIGMTPHDVIRAATSVAALALGMEDRIGTLETGKSADLLVVRGNPLEDLSVLDQRRLVMLEGQIVHHAV